MEYSGPVWNTEGVSYRKGPIWNTKGLSYRQSIGNLYGRKEYMTPILNIGAAAIKMFS